MNRRKFLEQTSAAAAALASGCGTSATGDATSAKPFLSGWGQVSDQRASSLLSGTRRPEGVLELFLMGGLNPWDTFYVVPEHGDPKRNGAYSGQQWWTFQNGEESVPDHFALCGGGDRALYEPFGFDSNNKQVNLGPWLWPLRDRPDILRRTRLFVMSHDLEPHQAAAPLVLGGQPRGTPRLATTGAHVQRFWQDKTPNRTAPFSYVLHPNTHYVAGFNAEASFAVGNHPGRARPLAVRVMADNPLAQQLSRSQIADRGAVDAAMDYYVAKYRSQYRGYGASQLEQYAYAREAMRRAPELQSILTEDVLAPVSGSECGDDADLDVTAMGLNLGAHLLTSPMHAAQYVHVVDSGLVEAVDGGYDTHNYHVRATARNTVHMCRRLSAIINEPDERDPQKLDLDRHMIVLSTEMGRSPYPELGSIRGLNHWPYGFIVAVIGGPISEEESGIVGAIGEDARATEFITPAEFRLGLLLAQGIWPFSHDAFAIPDVRGVGTELDAAMRVRDLMWGMRT